MLETFISHPMIILPVLVSCLKQQVFTIGFIFALFLISTLLPFPYELTPLFKKCVISPLFLPCGKWKGVGCRSWESLVWNVFLSPSSLLVVPAMMGRKERRGRKPLGFFGDQGREREGGVGSLDDMLLADVLDP